MERQIIEIKNLNDVAMNVGSFDKAVETDLFYGNETSTEKVENFKGIYNMNSGKVCSVVGKGYQIIQHNDIISAVSECLAEKGLDVSGRINNYGDNFVMDLAFSSNGEVVKDDASGIQIGMKISNSYNKKSSFRLEMFGFRMICQNGMSLGSVMNNIKEAVFHVGKEKLFSEIKSITTSFIDSVIGSSDKLQKLVTESMADKIEWRYIPEFLEKHIKRKKHIIKILESLGIARIEIIDENTGAKRVDYILNNKENTLVNRWDLYNVCTAYATHTENIGFGVEKRVQNTAQTILGNSFQKLIPIKVEVN